MAIMHHDLQWLLYQSRKFQVLKQLKWNCYSSLYKILPYIADDCVLDSRMEILALSGKCRIEEYLVNIDKKLTDQRIHLDAQWVESGDDFLLRVRRKNEPSGFLVKIQLNDENLISQFIFVNDDSLPFRVFSGIAVIIPMLYDQRDEDVLENPESKIYIPDLYFDELNLFMDKALFVPLDLGDGYHLYPDDWNDVLARWRQFYETMDFDTIYNQWMEEDQARHRQDYYSELLKRVWKNKEYGWKYLEALEDMVRQLGKKYDILYIF